MLNDEQKSAALTLFWMTSQAVRRRLAKYLVDRKRPTTRELESMASVLAMAEYTAAKMDGKDIDIGPVAFYPSDFSELREFYGGSKT